MASPAYDLTVELSQRLRDALGVKETLSLLGLDPPRGRSLRCPLPGHEDRHPSASIYQGRDSEMWKCHTCGIAGDVVTLVQKVRGIRSRLEAAKWLASRAGIHVPELPKDYKPRKRATEADYHAALARYALPVFPHGLEEMYKNAIGDILYRVMKWDQEEMPFDFRIRGLKKWYYFWLDLAAKELVEKKSVD